MIALAGNKCDLASKRKVESTEASEYAKDNGLFFMETSAKTAYNVEQAFLKTAEEIYGKISSGEIDVSNESHGIKVGMAQSGQLPGLANDSGVPKRQSGCC